MDGNIVSLPRVTLRREKNDGVEVQVELHCCSRRMGSCTRLTDEVCGKESGLHDSVMGRLVSCCGPLELLGESVAIREKE